MGSPVYRFLLLKRSPVALMCKRGGTKASTMFIRSAAALRDEPRRPVIERSGPALAGLARSLLAGIRNRGYSVKFTGENRA